MSETPYPFSAFRITPSAQRGVIVLELAYEVRTMFELGSGRRLGRALIDHYREMRALDGVKNPSCVVLIRADVAGSAVVKALFELYQIVHLEKGDLACVGYPKDYLPALEGMGLTSLPGFSMPPTVEAALDQLSTPPTSA